MSTPASTNQTADFVPVTSTKALSLDPATNSDHAMIGLKQKSIRIMASNISNPQYHAYFASGPFATTHLNTSKIDPDPTKRAWLCAKIQIQLRDIVDGFLADDWDCYVIIEAYNQFIDQLKTKLNNTGFGSSYQIVGTVDPADHANCKNKTIILVNLKRQHSLLCDSRIIIETYPKDRSDNQTSSLEIPVVRIKDLSNSKKISVFGIHLSGCDTQFPVNAITALKKILTQHQTDNPSEEIIAIGDFNTVPKNIMAVMNGSNLSVMTPTYMTHINPRYEVVSYDNVVWTGLVAPIQLPLNEMDSGSQLFVRKLEEFVKS